MQTIRVQRDRLPHGPSMGSARRLHSVRDGVLEPSCTKASLDVVSLTYLPEVIAIAGLDSLRLSFPVPFTHCSCDEADQVGCAKLCAFRHFGVFIWAWHANHNENVPTHPRPQPVKAQVVHHTSTCYYKLSVRPRRNIGWEGTTKLRKEPAGCFEFQGADAPHVPEAAVAQRNQKHQSNARLLVYLPVLVVIVACIYAYLDQV